MQILSWCQLAEDPRMVWGKLARLTETAGGAVYTVSPALAHPDTNQVLSKAASSSGRNAARVGLLTEKSV